MKFNENVDSQLKTHLQIHHSLLFACV